MADPFSALGIAAFAFLNGFMQSDQGKKFIESIVGKLGEKTLEAGLKKADELKQKVVQRLRGNANAEKALVAAEQGDRKALEDVADYLKVAMKEDQDFAEQVKILVQEIRIDESENTSQVQNQTVESGGVGYQTQTGNENTNFIGGTHYHGKPN